MTTKKSPKDKVKQPQGIQINRNRGAGKKKPDLFAHLRNTEHPLDTLIPLSEVLPSTNIVSERPQLEVLPSTSPIQLPSINIPGERPPEKNSAVHKLNILPSTINLSDRPQYDSLPSTTEIVDVEPSTTVFLPSTKDTETSEVDGSTSTVKNKPVHKSKQMPSTKSDRHNKDLARYDNRVDPQIKQRIDMFCAEFRFTQKDFSEQSAVHFIEVWTAKLRKNVDGNTAHDDLSKMIMWKTNATLINLYRAYNPENKWKFRDDEAASKHNLADLRLIELGIIETQFNSKFKKINSFTYYENEIQNFASQRLGEEMLACLIKHYRQKWQASTGREIDLEFLKKEV